MVNKVTIIGLGLIGGSVAKALRRVFPDCCIIAVDKNKSSCVDSLKEKITNRIYTEISDECIGDISDSDIIYLCVGSNVCGEIISILANKVNNKEMIITDVCSTKSEIKHIFENVGVNYIGGHPMAGSEKSGYPASSEYLLENAVYILCPSEDTKDEALEFMKNIVSSMGSLPFVMDAEAHDEAMAGISHLPHIAASALVNTAADCSNGDILRTLAAGGFKDITRIASGDPRLWKSIVMSNRDNIIKAIDGLTDNLKLYKEAIQRQNEDELYLLFERARKSREDYETGRKAIMNLMYEINIDVPDKPGIIAEISAKLTENNVNIKNIYIAESRDNELGCMRLAFETKDARDKAALVLGVNI